MHDDDFDPTAGSDGGATATAPAPDHPAELTPEAVRQLESFVTSQEAINRARTDADAIGEIADRDTAGRAADAVKALRDALRDAESARKDTKGPYDRAATLIHTGFKELMAPSEAAEQSLKDRIIAFDAAEQERVEEERKQAEEEQAEAQAAEEEAAAEEGRRSKTVLAPPPPPAPRGARGARSKVTPTDTWEYEVTDEDELPDEYVTRTPNRKKIRAHVEAGVQIPGVKAWRGKRAQVR